MSKSKRTKKPPKRTKSIGGPFVVSAFTCEKVLKEGNVPTFVRVIDTFQVSGHSPKMSPGIIQFVLFIAFKAGDVRGKKTMMVRCESPGGDQETFESLHTLEFRGGSSGAATEIEVLMGIKDPGIYWFIVTLDGRLMTKIPVDVVYQQAPQITEQQTESTEKKIERRKRS